MSYQKNEDTKNGILEEIYQKNLEEYINYIKGENNDKEYIMNLEREYNETVLMYVRNIENTLSEEILKNNTREDIGINELIPPHLCQNELMKKILENTLLDGLIYVDNSKSAAHFHVKKMIIIETELLETLPDLILELKNKNFNTLFNGRNIVEVRYILEQMKVLPKDSQLEKSVNNYFIARKIRGRLIESIICMLIIHGKDEYTKDRVWLLKKIAGIYIDVSRYINANPKKLTLKNEDN